MTKDLFIILWFFSQISKLILYSKTLSRDGKSAKKEAKESGEIYKICKILSESYSNIIFLNDVIIENENDILSLLNAKTKII